MRIDDSISAVVTGGASGLGLATVKALREAGLLAHGAGGYGLTPLGVDLLRRIGDLPAFAARWSLGQTRKR